MRGLLKIPNHCKYVILGAMEYFEIDEKQSPLCL